MVERYRVTDGFLWTMIRTWIVAFVLLSLFGFQPIDPPEFGSWSSPAVVFDAGTSPINGFDLAVDPSGELHLFTSFGGWNVSASDLDEVMPDNVIMYIRGDGASWSEPIDIAVNEQQSQYRQASVDAIADEVGNLHMVISNAPLQYWRASVYDAMTAHSWNAPDIGLGRIPVLDAKLTVSEGGVVHLAYSETPGNVYYARSEDSGRNWLLVTRVSDTEASEATADSVDIAVDAEERIHIVWHENQMPGGYPPTGVFYSRSDDRGQTWKSPVQLGAQYGARPAIVIVGGVINVVWGSSNADKGRYFTSSHNGGNSWRPAQLLAKTMGLPLPFERDRLAVDSSERVYWILSDETDRGAVDRFVSQSGTGWSELQSLSLPFPLKEDGFGDLRGASALVSEGNRLHLILLELDKETRTSRLWYTSQEVDSRHISPQSLPTPADETFVSIASASDEPVTTSQQPIGPMKNPSIQPSPSIVANPTLPLIAGVLPAGIFLGIVLTARLYRQRH